MYGADLQWHEYLVHLPTANRQTTGGSETGWDRNVDWIRLDPLGDSKAGDQIDIDYVAFFSTREAAEDFRGKSIPDGFTMLRPGAHVFHLGDRLVFREPWEKLEGMRAVGAIRVHTNAAGGAYFTSVEVEQVGVLRGILNVVELNGQALTVTLHTDPGGVYVYNEEAYFEHVKGVRLYFQSQLTGEIHGEYSTLPADDGEDSEDPG